MPRFRWTHLIALFIVISMIGMLVNMPFRNQDHDQAEQYLNSATENNLLMTKLKGDHYLRIFESLFISVKTTQKFHTNRLNLILETWFNEAPQQTYFFSDAEDSVVQNRSGNHLINTGCSSSHSRKSLSCKMSVELETFIKHNDKRWFCHFDDDNYVNVYQLVKLLEDYNPQDDWYLGRISTNIPIIVPDKKKKKNISFWFATGGAGFCLSRSLVSRMTPYIAGGQFITIGDDIRLPDDVTLGYIVDYLLNVPVTVIHKFHSHLEPMKSISHDKLAQQISLSYSNNTDYMNVVDVDALNLKALDKDRDPTRFLSLHCYLVPTSKYCFELESSKQT